MNEEIKSFLKWIHTKRIDEYPCELSDEDWDDLEKMHREEMSTNIVAVSE